MSEKKPEPLIYTVAQFMERVESSEADLRKGGPGSTSGGMEERITRLEEWSKVASERLGRIETKLDTLPSKTDMLSMFLGVFVVLGLVFAALSWLGDRASNSGSAPTPIIIQVPATQSPPLPPCPAGKPACKPWEREWEAPPPVGTVVPR